MNLEILPDLEALVNTLLSESKCACHIINPHKTRILMWKEVKNDKTTYYLRIGVQKFVSQEQLDRNGEVYWRYFSFEAKEGGPTHLDSITKFQPKPEKAYDKPNSTEPSVNGSSN